MAAIATATNAMAQHELVITRTFDAPRALVFKAFTTPTLLQRWMLGPGGWTMPICEIDLRPGGSFRYVWRKGAIEMVMTGTFQEIVPPERIVHRETFQEDWTGGETLVTTTFKEASGRTTVAITVRYSSAEARAGALETGMVDGMAGTYDRLAELLASGEVA